MTRTAASGAAAPLPFLRFEPSLAIRFLLIALLVNLACLPALLFIDLATYTAENSIIEGPQALLLVIAALVFLRIAAATRGIESAVCFASVAVAGVAFSRELMAPDSMAAMVVFESHAFRYGVAIIFIGLAVYRLAGDMQRLPALWRWLLQLGWWPYLLTLVLLVLGEFFEKQNFMDRMLGQFVEESLELAAYVVYLQAALVLWGRIRS